MTITNNAPTTCAEWNANYGHLLDATAPMPHPITTGTPRPRFTPNVEFDAGFAAGEITWDGDIATQR